VLLGALAALAPLGALLIGGAFLLAVAVFVFANRLRHAALSLLGLVLIGYAFLGRGFAYIGVPPLFIGEVALGAGLVAVAVAGWARNPLRSRLVRLLTAFMAWGALCTIPYLGEFGVTALRDAVIWGYALFAVVVAALVDGPRLHAVVEEQYPRLVPVLLLWAPVAAVAYRFAGQYIPQLPGSDVPIIGYKGGDMAVHLAGAAAFMLLGLHRQRGHSARLEWVWWFVWIVGVGMAITTVRAALLAVCGALLPIFVLQPNRRWVKLLAVGLATVMIAAAFDVSLDIGNGRTISVDQIIRNVQSIVGNGDHDALSGTKEWRLAWWREIVDYTFRGPHFWTGKGYGINLADDDGFQVYDDHSLRSPHNGHLTVLARSGVPGLVLWTGLQLGFAASLGGAYLRATLAGKTRWAKIYLWLLSYWSAFVINGTFDVYLEGPQGGIWFWSLFGFGLAALAVQQEEQEGVSHDPSGSPGPQLLPAAGGRGRRLRGRDHPPAAPWASRVPPARAQPEG